MIESATDDERKEANIEQLRVERETLRTVRMERDRCPDRNEQVQQMRASIGLRMQVCLLTLTNMVWALSLSSDSV